MPTLHEILAERVSEWRKAGFPSQEFSAIAEVLEFATLEDGSPRFLRWPQIRALETYWYLRLVEKTPHIFDLYRAYYHTPTELLGSLGLYSKEVQDYVINHDVDALWEHIRTDEAFSKANKLEALRETLRLDYPSYIFALAMGAGKTILIGTIIATEFAMALEYPRGPFVQNALVFAPGKTILESLRQLADIPFDKILPPRLYKPFAASVKLTFTRDGEKDLPVIHRSFLNIVVTNTEKIRIQKPTGRNGQNKIGILWAEKQKQEEEIANLRLQAIASLPHLAIFSDEAHHTYGQSLDAELKKVRKTVDYLHQNSPNLICVVNTTGTPYYQKQPLKDVVIWYGLSQGIRDNILKEVAGNVFSFDFDDANTGQFLSHVVKDFFEAYRQVTLPNGAPARMAIYFPQTDDLAELRPVVDTTLAELGLPATLVLEHTSKTPQENEDAFNRLAYDPTAPHRLILLVNKGTEGWDCPSLFACALARKLRSSNNFVLQAASRCLRQVPGNRTKARIYLSQENEGTLDRQLQETYGEKLSDFKVTKRQRGVAKLVLRKLNMPPLVIRKVIRSVVRKEVETSALFLTRPAATTSATMLKRAYEFSAHLTGRRVMRETDEQQIDLDQEYLDVYAAAVELAAIFHLDPWEMRGKLRELYPGETEIPLAHVAALASKVEEQCRNYETREETVEHALALVKPDGFTKEHAEDDTEIYTAEITYPLDKENLLARWEEYEERSEGFGFHYTPYNFDSEPEKDFFDQLLALISANPAEIEDIYFTGALTDPKKSDFRVEYRGEDGRWHDYTPDFVIRRKDGRCLVVEIKSAQFETSTLEDRKRAAKGKAVLTTEGRKAMALQRWVEDNPDRLRYELIFTKSAPIPFNKIKPAKEFVEETAQ
jgi:type III restriction enzyme